MRRTLTLFAFLAIAVTSSSVIAIACSDFDEGSTTTPPDGGGPEAAADDGGTTSNDGGSGDAGSSDPVVDISPGMTHACALRKSGKVTCWGRNAELELGFDDPATPDTACTDKNGTNFRCRQATDVPKLANVTQVSAGNQFTCARSMDGVVKCWGDNANGALGLGVNSPTTRAAAEPVLDLPPNALDVAAGGSGACSRVMVGSTVEVYCWGTNKRGGLTISPASGAFYKATKLAALSNAKAVSLSLFSDMGCAILGDDSVVCWGLSSSGSLGHTTSTSGDVDCGDFTQCNPKPSPVGVNVDPIPDGGAGSKDSGTDTGGAALTGVKEISVSQFGACARMIADDTIRCWGYAGYGQIGQGVVNPGDQPAPLTVPIGPVTSFASRGSHTCAVVAGGQLKCWGLNATGELGNNNASDVCGFFAGCKSSPQNVVLPNVAHVINGGASTFAQTTDGNFFSWGANPDGRLGHAPSTSNDLAKCSADIVCNPIPQPLTLP